MSHGSKRFIKAYDGRIKRSNDRTKKDYYRELKWWDEPYYSRFSRYPWYRYGKKNTFCPQCKHIQKPLEREHEEREQWKKELEQQYYHLYGYAEALWEEYRRLSETGSYYIGHDYKEYWHPNFVKEPNIPKPPGFSKWSHGLYWYGWCYDPRSYLCWKCERKYEKRREMWCNHHSTGQKNNYRWTRRYDYKMYKNKVKSVMQRAKYDEDLYDDIPVYKRGWLD